MKQKEVSMGAPRRKVYESALATRISNAAEDSEDLLPLQLSYSPVFLQREYAVTIVIIHMGNKNFLLLSIILLVQVAVGYTVNPQISVLHPSGGEKKWQHMKLHVLLPLLKTKTAKQLALEVLFLK